VIFATTRISKQLNDMDILTTACCVITSRRTTVQSVEDVRRLHTHVFGVRTIHSESKRNESDRKLFRQATQPGHSLHHLLPLKTSTYRPYQLRKRQHPYLLPTVQYSQFKNCYINRCLFKHV